MYKRQIADAVELSFRPERMANLNRWRSLSVGVHLAVETGRCSTGHEPDNRSIIVDTH